MREPIYEYDFPDMYMAPQKHFPLRRQFDRQVLLVLFIEK